MKKLEEILKDHPHLSVPQLNALKKASTFYRMARRSYPNTADMCRAATDDDGRETVMIGGRGTEHDSEGNLAYLFAPGEAKAAVDSLEQAIDEAITTWLHAQLAKVKVEQ